MLNNKPTLKELDDLKNKTFLEPNELNFIAISKQIYQIFYYSLTNLYEYCKMSKYSKYYSDKKYIKNIIDKQDLDMTEVRTKTDLALKNYPDLYWGVMRWISGCCWSNSLITNGYESELLDIDKQIISSINKSIKLVESINKPLVLFHGFEKFSNYKEDNLQVGKIFKFPGILSKTSKFDIAKQFANTQNYFQPKFLIVFYPKGSKHIGLDIKPTKYDEYEYIGKQNETFKIIRICEVFNGLKLQKFYICENLDYNNE